MRKRYLLWGLFFGLFAVLLGAFGAHGLKSVLTEQQLSSFETGVRYQMYHAILLILLSKYKNIATRTVLNIIVTGVLLFSLSIYLLNIKELMGMDFLSMLGPVTPIGGILIILGWSMLIVNVVKKYKSGQ